MFPKFKRTYLLFLHKEEVVQSHDAVVLDLLQDVQFSIFIFFVLEDVLHGEEFLGRMLTNLNDRGYTRYTFPNVPLPTTSRISYLS
jgi:hypothetical protein